jgi:hypothetical protein
MTNASCPTEIGKLTPDAVGAVLNVFIGTVPVEMYCPVMYMFPTESTAILRPISPPALLIVEYPASVPFASHLMTNASMPVVIGKLTPVDVGAVPNVFIGTVVVEIYCPVTYIFPTESTVIPYPISLPLPLIVE